MRFNFIFHITGNTELASDSIHTRYNYKFMQSEEPMININAALLHLDMQGHNATFDLLHRSNTSFYFNHQVCGVAFSRRY